MKNFRLEKEYRYLAMLFTILGIFLLYLPFHILIHSLRGTPGDPFVALMESLGLPTAFALYPLLVYAIYSGARYFYAILHPKAFRETPNQKFLTFGVALPCIALVLLFRFNPFDSDCKLFILLVCVILASVSSIVLHQYKTLENQSDPQVQRIIGLCFGGLITSIIVISIFFYIIMF